MADVNVTVGADSSNLATGLAKAERSVDNFGKNAAASFGKMQTAFVAVTAAFATFGALNGILEDMGRVRDLADRFGESAEGIQRIGYAASQSGSDVETVVKGLQKAGSAAVDAAKGNEAANEAFAALNLNAADFVSMSTEEKLAALAEGFSTAKNSTLAYDAVLQLMGKSGGELIPLLSQGADGVKEAFESAAVASDDAVSKLDDVGDRIGAAFSSIKTYGAEAISYLLDRVEALGTGLAAIVAFIGELPNGLDAAKKAFEDTTQAAADLKVEEQESKKEDRQKRKEAAKIDPEQLQAAKTTKDKAKKDAEDEAKDVARLKADIAKKEAQKALEEMPARQRAEALQTAIDEQDSIANANGPDSLEGLKAQERAIELQEQLAKVKKEVAAEDKKSADALRKSELDDSKELLSQGKDRLSKLERGGATPIDSLRAVGGGAANVNYEAVSKRDALQQQGIELAKQNLDQLKKAVDYLSKVASVNGGASDGSFT